MRIRHSEEHYHLEGGTPTEHGEVGGRKVTDKSGEIVWGDVDGGR